MCRRHKISVTPHKERSVGVIKNALKISVSERRDLYSIKKIKQSNKYFFPILIFFAIKTEVFSLSFFIH